MVSWSQRYSDTGVRDVWFDLYFILLNRSIIFFLRTNKRTDRGAPEGPHRKSVQDYSRCSYLLVLMLTHNIVDYLVENTFYHMLPFS